VELVHARQAIVESIRTRLEKTRMKGAVLGLSGGVDSSLALVLSQEAIGNRVTALILPEEDVTPEQDVRDAVHLAQRRKVPFRVVEIGEIVKEVLRRMKVAESPETQVAVGNVKPRIRMTLLYLSANLEDRLVIGTSNKSELLMGYGTKYGDLGADIYPLGDLYKTQVWQLAGFVGLPVSIVKKAPSPRLWKGQTTEGEIGKSYRALDEILFALADLEMTAKEACERLGYREADVRDLHERVRRNEHKRKVPTITRFTRMCLDKDWRYPTERA
jgi:NAD+ synthase